MGAGNSKPGHTVVRRILLALAVMLAVAAGAFGWYVSDYYHADAVALAAATDEDGAADGVRVQDLPSGELAFVPDDASSGFIFYPGGKVQPEAYAPLMTRCAQLGILCVVVRPPFNLAVFDANAADGVREQFPNITRWAIGGHSLGGVMAADYLSRHEESFECAVLLGAYTSADLTDYRGSVLLVVGTNDGVLNRQKYADARAMLPTRATELTIEGGNHAQFGDYGAQAGDGEATVPSAKQQEATARALHDALA